MEQGSSDSPPSIQQRLSALEALDVSLPAPAARTVEQALESAAGLDTEDARRLDLAVLTALEDGPDPRDLLERIDVGLLAALLTRRTAEATGHEQAELREATWQTLDLIRLPVVLRRIPVADRADWAVRILAAIEASHFTVGPLFRRRTRLYGSRPLFEIPRADSLYTLTWRQAAARVERLARGLLALVGENEPGPIAILSENRIETALVDLACLSSGLFNVSVPANATETDVEYILGHAAVQTVIVSNRGSELAKVRKARERLPRLEHVVVVEPQTSRVAETTTLQELIAGGQHVGAQEVERRGAAVRIDDPATVMYTSGTTGMPKGILFSHRNLVFKRFARALALPEIGEDDVLLSFLPLYHTFGRFLELLGCVFWGARYCFLSSTSIDSMVRRMRRTRPTVFISVPKKWMQLYEAVRQRADPMTDSDEALLAAVHDVTGDRLRWGLSAAGYLDSDIFRFFQRNGVELMSGFGMTEATGGITMTPPGEYRDDSLGLALPGIQTRLADDGELLVRGPYVMIGYLDPPDGEPSFDAEGWFHTGDLMETDSHAHLRLVDRKKEIYKNVRGETIAPQRIENHFRDMESVRRAFLVGDHCEYNTLLIYPNHDFGEIDFSGMKEQEIRDHFRSLVVSVNKFLAPYERIVDFAVIDRDLELERGELTAKGTPRRQVVVRNFSTQIRSLYRRTGLMLGDVELMLPNWLLQTLGLTAQDIRVDGERLTFPSLGTSLTVAKTGAHEARVGSCLYRFERWPIDLGVLLNTPRLWLGNEELVRLVALDPEERQRPNRSGAGIHWIGRVGPFDATAREIAALEAAMLKNAWELGDVDQAARMLVTDEEPRALAAVVLLEKLLGDLAGPLTDPALMVLSRTIPWVTPPVRRRALQVLLRKERESRLAETLTRFFEQADAELDAETREQICRSDLSEARIEALIAFTQQVCGDAGTARREELAGSLMRLLAAYGARHPTRYRRLRAFLVRMNLFAASPSVKERGGREAESMEAGFRQWLGPNTAIAVDPETGQEYHWEEVVVFDEDVDEPTRQRLLSAIKNTAFLREAVFLFSRSVLIRLSDVPPGGVWIRHLGTRHGKSVYRITIQTRYQGQHEIAANVNHGLNLLQVQEEIHWLILGGDSGNRPPLVEDFGGYWPDEDLWSEEFIAGETLAHAMQRISRREDERERLKELWPFLAWTALSGYVDFWERSGRRWEIADPSMTNVVVPTDDFHTGVRIVSVSARRHHAGLPGMMRSFMEEFIRPAAKLYPDLAGVVSWDVVFSSVLEIVGEDEGLAMLRQCLQQPDPAMTGEIRTALDTYVANVQVRGFLPRRLFFAAKRYRRWAKLSGGATSQARARSLQEFYDTYGLAELARTYPETRVRFFRESVFRGSGGPLAEGLDELIAQIRAGEIIGEDLVDAIAELRSKLALGPEEDYFLTRLSLPYLRPEDAADFVVSRLGGRHQSEIVVTLEDLDGSVFRVRHALSPKEVGKLHRLFLSAKLDVRFRLEHRYLVAINDRSQIIAGIYYDIEEDGTTAHLEKIVVSEPYRRKGVADGLMTQLFNRLRAAGIKTVTTGFFRPEYFYAYGFRIEKRYAGLVKTLESDESVATTPGAQSAG